MSTRRPPRKILPTVGSERCILITLTDNVDLIEKVLDA